jgi:hypothetical protein
MAARVICVLLLLTLVLGSGAADTRGALSATAQDHGDHDEHGEVLGRVEFANSCSPAVQAEFNRAVALLHSFTTQQSRQAFTAVLESDPSCAMAHWGIAMTWLGNPLAGGLPNDAREAGWQAVASARGQGAPTQRERDYIAAIAAMHDPDGGPLPARRAAYARAMAQVAASSPADSEAAIFYALALNMAVDLDDPDHAKQLQAAAILEPLFVQQPDHPGIAHYLIHTYDYPPLAHLGLDAARRYARIAPSVTHALHMPSHTFTQLGLWEESIASNRACAAASPGAALHCLDYLTYALLQTAQDDAAGAVVARVASLPSPGQVPARYALERRRWDEATRLTVPPPFSLGRLETTFARALGAARAGDTAAAREEFEALTDIHERMIAGRDAGALSADVAEESAVLVLAATGWIAHAEGRNADAITLLHAAADREDGAARRTADTPRILPAREMLADLLLEVDKPGEALVAYETSNAAARNRFLGLYGAARAAELLGDREKATSSYAEVLRLAAGAESERPELQHARAYLATASGR